MKNNSESLDLLISGMHCHACAKAVETALKDISGVTSAKVNFATEKALVVLHTSIPFTTLESAVAAIGYQAHVITDASDTASLQAHIQRKMLRELIVVVLLALPFLVEMVLMLVGVHVLLPIWVQFLLATFIQIIGGWEFYRSSYRSLRQGNIGMDVLIVLGTTVAYASSVISWLLKVNSPIYFESSALIITMVLFGRWLESKSKGNASAAIQELMQLQPKLARVKRAGNMINLPLELIVEGDLILVRSGESLPVDGVIIEGEAEINEAMITGEAQPILKKIGDRVLTGTINLSGSLTIKALEIGPKTVLASIMRLVAQAQHSKAPIQRLADQLAGIFVPLVLSISLLTFVGWLISGVSLVQALYPAVAVLVIACPCALGLATPIVITVACGQGAFTGIIFKDAQAIELAGKLKSLFFDKTGTLTKGIPEVVKVIPFAGSTENEVLSVAIALENHVQHPLAFAILAEGVKQDIQVENIQNFKYVAGKGIVGWLGNEQCGIGIREFVIEMIGSYEIKLPDPHVLQGSSVNVVWKGDSLLGLVLTRDHLREGVHTMIQSLRDLGIHTMMLTGDKVETARQIADNIGIAEYRAELLPAEKLDYIRQARLQGAIVGMVGDGINDGPALALADVGIVVGNSSGVAIETASIAIMREDLWGVVEAIELSRAAVKKIKQNLGFAFIYNILAIPLAVFGMLDPVVAAIAMALSSVSVVVNALLLKVKVKPQIKHRENTENASCV